MKRFRTINFDFDSRPGQLGMEIPEHWDAVVKTQHIEDKERIRTNLAQQYGELNFELKEKNFIDLGDYFPSVISFHNKFLKQIRDSFVIGAYYPAFTGVTTLTERIFNHLLIKLRDHFKSTKEYKDVRDKYSFQNWGKAINILESWQVLLPETKDSLMKLKELRNQYAAHFNPIVDSDDRRLALEAIQEFQKFIKCQFGALGDQPWFIPGTKGEFFIKKEYEKDPFVSEFYLPNCVLVGPKVRFVYLDGALQAKDEEYANLEVTDSGFIKLRTDFSGKAISLS